MTEPLVIDRVDQHYRRDERGNPVVLTLGFMGMGKSYRWAYLSPTGWVELPRGGPPVVAWLPLEHVEQIVHPDWPAIVVPEATP